MLLVKLTVGVTNHYVSNEHLAIERFYDARVASLSQLRVATRQPYGGFAEPSYGQIEFLPTVFTASWPPPMSCPIVISIAVTGESDAEIIFEGTAHLNEPKRDGIIYDLYGPEITTTVTDAVYADTLVNIFSAACTTLSLTLDSTKARVSSPAVDYMADGKNLLIDNLSDMAAFFTHRFYIENSTLYLIDCLLDNGTLAMTEFDVFSPSYPAPSPIKKVTAKYTAEIDKYRFIFTANQGGAYVGISEIVMRSIATDGADETTATGGAASALNYYGAGYEPSKAVDDNAATDWVSSTGPSSTLYWAFDFSANVKVVEYTIQARSSTFNQSPTAWLFQGYDEETAEWRTIKEEETEADWTASEVRKFSVTPPEWDVIVDGSHAYGEGLSISPVCHTARAGIETALTNIKTVMERMRIRMVKPLSGVPKIGRKITITDESMYITTTVWARVAAVVWDFDGEQCVIEGEGTLS